MIARLKPTRHPILNEREQTMRTNTTNRANRANIKTRYQLKIAERTLRLLVRREREKSREALDLSRRCSAHAQHASRTLTLVRRIYKRVNRFPLCALLCAVVMACASQGAHADDRKCEKRCENRNYIIERQQAYQVEGVPTSRIIVGRREIDGYRQSDGSKVWFEKNNVVGVTK